MSNLVLVLIFVVLIISNDLGYASADENRAGDQDETMFQKMEHLVMKLAEYERRLTHLQAKQTSCERKLDSYENNLVEVQKEQNRMLHALEDKITLLEAKQDSGEQTVKENKQEVSMNGQLMYNVSQDAPLYHALRPKRVSAESPAFYAYMSADSCIGSHEVFLFDVEVTNIGGGYNKHDGIFDVPISGIYVFTFTVFCNYHHYVRAELIVDGQVKGVILADSNEISDYHTATSTVVLHVNAGDHVFVRRSDSYSECNVLSNFGRALTTFAGWMLFAD